MATEREYEVRLEPQSEGDTLRRLAGEGRVTLPAMPPTTSAPPLVRTQRSASAYVLEERESES